MKFFVESRVLSPTALEVVRNLYLGALCEAFEGEGCAKRVTVEGWKGKKSKAIVFASPREWEEARAAARYRDNDGVSFGAGTLRFFDESEALLLLQFEKVAEVRIREVVKDYRYLSDLRRSLNVALNKEVPVVFTCSPSKPFEVCSPFQVLALCESLGYSEEDVKALWGLGSNFLISLAESKGMRTVLRGER